MIRLSDDLLDQDFAELLAMTVELAVALTTLLVEDEDLVTLHEGSDDFANHLSTFHYGRTDGDCTILIDEENLVKLYYCSALCTLNVVDEEATALLQVELLALDVYDDVHCLVVTITLAP